MVSDSIFEMLKDYLHITYTLDESSERRIRNEAQDGIAYLQSYMNPEATCEPGTPSARYLCEYVLRAEAGALETFAEDYAKDIISGKAIFDADGYAKAKGYEETEG